MILQPSPATQSFPKLARLGARRLSRAHLLLNDRAPFVAAVRKATDAAAAALSAQLGTPLTADAHLVDNAVSLGRVLPKASGYALIDLSPLGATGVLDVEPAFLNGLLEKLCGGKGKPAPVAELTRIEQVAFGFLCTVALAALRKEPLVDTRFTPRLLSVHGRRDEILDRLAHKERHLCIDVRMEVGELSGAVRFLMPVRAAQAAIQELPATKPSSSETAISKVGVPFRPRMGKAALSPQELIDLGRGDVVVFAGMALAQGQVTGPVRLLGTSFDLGGNATPEGFQVSRAYLRGPRTELPMNGKNDATCMLPIELEVELARVQLPVADLAAIKPGAVVPLRINAADPVVIRIGERAVAKAELVEIDGEVGARIISMLA